MSVRRPRKTAIQWEKLVEQQSASGLSIANFCKQRDIVLSTFSKWHRKFKIGSTPARTSFKRVEALEPTVAEEPVSPSSVISVQLGSDILLTIRSGEGLP